MNEVFYGGEEKLCEVYGVSALSHISKNSFAMRTAYNSFYKIRCILRPILAYIFPFYGGVLTIPIASVFHDYIYIRRTELSYYLFSALTCAVDMFHLFIDYVDLCFSCRNRKCVYFALASKRIIAPKI